MVGRGRITTFSNISALLLFFFGTGGIILLYTTFSVCSGLGLAPLVPKNSSSAYIGFYQQVNIVVS